MSSPSAKKLKKQRDRAKEVKRVKLLKQEDKFALNRDAKNYDKKLRRVREFQQRMGNLNMYSEEMLMNLKESTLIQLEKNAKILRALEEEYQEEINKKRELNEKLESAGMVTLEEKLKHLHDDLVKQQQDAVTEFMPPKKEVAEVELIKANPD